MIDVYVGLGSNIEPERNVPRAVRRLTAAFGEMRVSPVYRCPAVGMRGADFMNLVVGFRSAEAVDSIEAVLTELEADSGRVRSREVVSRTLDLDLLLYGACVDPIRRLPRDDVLRYPFVLCPLADIAPAARHPVSGETYSDAWARMAPGNADTLVRLGSVERI